MAAFSIDRQYTWKRQFSQIREEFSCFSQLTKSDGMRRPVSGRDAVGSQVINALEAQKIKETEVSTVEAKQSRKISQSKLTVGLDLGDRTSWYCVLDEAGRVLLEQRVSTTPKAL